MTKPWLVSVSCSKDGIIFICQHFPALRGEPMWAWNNWSTWNPHHGSHQDQQFRHMVQHPVKDSKTSLRNQSFRFHQLLPDVTRCYCFNFRPGNSCNAHDPQQAHQPDHAGVVRPATESTEHTTSNGHPGVDRNNAPILAFRHPLCPPWFIFGEVSEPNFTAPDNMDNQIKFLQKLRSPNFLEFLLRFRNLRL